jgi:hypothetical protein
MFGQRRSFQDRTGGSSPQIPVIGNQLQSSFIVNTPSASLVNSIPLSKFDSGIITALRGDGIGLVPTGANTPGSLLTLGAQGPPGFLGSPQNIPIWFPPPPTPFPAGTNFSLQWNLQNGLYWGVYQPLPSVSTSDRGAVPFVNELGMWSLSEVPAGADIHWRFRLNPPLTLPGWVEE